MNTLKLGVIGAGRIGKVHAASISQRIEQAEVIAIADPDIDEAEQLTRKLGIPMVSKDPMDIIQHADVDAVVICSPTDTHTEYIRACASQKKHIFCEKPVDLNLDKIKNILEVVNDAGIQMMVGFNRRFDPNFAKIKELVSEGKIGDPQVLKITSRDPGPPPPQYIISSGGLFLDMAIHDFDMARFIVQDEVEEVYSKGAVMIDEEIGRMGDIDTAITTLQFKNGALGVIDNSRKAVYGYDQRLEVFGSGGMAKIDNNLPENHEFFDGSGSHRSLPLNFFMERYTESYYLEMCEFVDAILKGKPLSVSGNDGLVSVAIGLAARKSVEEKRPVRLDEIL
jgi:myo-inositol 2-dehydrogenase/D-chiro-inositol 1-dehydrogenase